MSNFQPVTEQLQVQISKQQLRIIPSSSSVFQANGAAGSSQKLQAKNSLTEREFEVEVVNQSDRFASFEVELSTPGKPAVAGNHWYDVDPKVCAKKPPGERTTFRVVINCPPIPAINTTLDLEVHIFSVEYEDLESTRYLQLAIERGNQDLQVHLVSPQLKAYPGQPLAIEVLAMNLQSEPAEVTLKLLGLKDNWFVQPATDGGSLDSSESSSPRIIHDILSGGDARRMTFHCMPPSQPLTARKTYTFDVEISDRNGSDQSETALGQIEILPAGMVTFDCDPRCQAIPSTAWSRSHGKAVFPLTFTNRSNLLQHLQIQATESNQHRCDISPLAPVDLSPGDEQVLDLEIRRRQPWLGWERRLLIDVVPTITHPDTGSEDDVDPIYLKPSNQILDVRVRPLIPLWLQIIGGTLGLLLTAWWIWLRPIVRHEAPITTVQIMGRESTVLTGSRDQTVYRWDVNTALGWFRHAPRLRPRSQLATSDQLGRAVRVIRQSPEEKNQVAIGLENGVIDLWDFDRTRQIRRIADQTDRVFALAFADNGRWLFSGHGSGTVRKWNAQKKHQTTPERVLYLPDTAITDLETLDHEGRSWVAIGGQFNRLLLWDPSENNTVLTTNYSWSRKFNASPVISSYHSLTEIDISSDDRLLVTSDNRGFITVWDSQKLLECRQKELIQTFEVNSGGSNDVIAFNCPQPSIQLEQWQATEDGIAVRTMALSGDGCYLATATDKGKISLWILDPKTGKKSELDAITIATFNGYSPYEIDIEQHDRNHLLFAVDSPGNRARLFKHKLDKRMVCSPNL